MKKFEYYTIYGRYGDDMDCELDRLGECGWEAFAVVPDDSGVVVYLKREKAGFDVT